MTTVPHPSETTKLTPPQLLAKARIEEMLADYKRQGKNQTALGEALAVKQSFISAIKRGQKGAGLELRMRLAQIFPEDYEALVGEPPPIRARAPVPPPPNATALDPVELQRERALSSYLVAHPDADPDIMREVADFLTLEHDSDDAMDVDWWVDKLQSMVPRWYAHRRNRSTE